MLEEWIDGGNGERFTIMGREYGDRYKNLCVKPLEPVRLGGYRYYVNGQLIGRMKTRRAAMRAAERYAAEQLAEII